MSKPVCEHILTSNFYCQSQYIYAYYPLGNEVDIRPVIEKAWKDGKHVAFPKVFGKQMTYFEVSGFEQLHPGTFHVMEPEETLPVEWEKALVLTPGVAFDRDRNRMGYGGGYYDRYFEKKTGCIMLAVAYELQMAEKIPVGQYDRVLDGVVTEHGMI